MGWGLSFVLDELVVCLAVVVIVRVLCECGLFDKTLPKASVAMAIVGSRACWTPRWSMNGYTCTVGGIFQRATTAHQSHAHECRIDSCWVFFFPSSSMSSLFLVEELCLHLQCIKLLNLFCMFIFPAALAFPSRASVSHSEEWCSRMPSH